MMRKLLSAAMLFLTGILCASAQMPQPQQLPLNPKVRHGVLSNGMNYYIMHNEEPKNRANFYIAQKVGSTLETPTQLGLAHFLEHMAFNGTKNYPGKNLLNYLQSKGIRFGADINAYTGFDETVYNIDNIPCTDQALMDSVLLALHDWSCAILLESAEIDAERGVIREEWRGRNDAGYRWYSKALKDIFDEYQYQQMPIGSMDVVMNFKYDELRDYYHRWYRPDQQGIVIVGDFDVDAMEKKVKDLFSTIEMPKNAPKREYPKVSDNKKMLYSAYEDPELESTQVIVMFKSDKFPFNMRNTDQMYVADLLQKIVATLVNHRLSDEANKAECKYTYAGTYFGNFLVSATKDAYSISIQPKNQADIEGAVREVMAIVTRALTTGFTINEWNRVRDEYMSLYENAYNERDKQSNKAQAKAIIRHFIDNTPEPGIEMEWEIAQNMLPQLPVEVINQLASQILTSENQAVMLAMPKKDGIELISADIMEKAVNEPMNAKYEALVDEVITDPLIAQLPKPGSVTNVKENPVTGATEFTLSNGVKVIVKSTDFAADQIMMQAFRNGGKRAYPESQAANVLMAGDVFSLSKLGPFDTMTLQKYLAGKNASLGFEIARVVDTLEGGSTVKDLPTLMELIYAAFTSLGADEENFKVNIDRARPRLEGMVKTPDYQFDTHRSEAIYGDNKMMMPVGINTINEVNYNEALNLVKNSLSNAADYTFIFTGNVDLATIRPLLEQYIATLPVARRKKVAEVTSILPRDGKIVDNFKIETQAPIVKVFENWSGNIPYTVENSSKVDLLGDIFQIHLTEKLREEEGGTYSPGAGAYIDPVTNIFTVVAIYDTNSDQVGRMLELSQQILEDLLKNGADAERFNKVREAAIKQHENNIRTNGYWMNNLSLYERGINNITGAEEALKNLTLEDFNAFIKGLYNGKNNVEVVMTGEPAAK